MAKLSLGLDFGTESVRALLVDVETGEEVAERGFSFPHGVLDAVLPCREATPLGPDWFLQHPQDYLDGLAEVVPAALREGGASGADVVGIGLDFTSCTMMPTDARGTPLCLKEEFAADPQAWVKLWKHHGAAAEAARIAEVAEERGEKFMDYYAHAISSEWLVPKALETRRRSPKVYEAAWTFVEGADWVAWQLTGRLARNACCAGFKAQYIEELGGYPSREFLEAVEPGFGDLFLAKMPGEIVPAGRAVGDLTPEWATRLGLEAGTPVSAAMIDAHMGVPGVGVTEAGKMVIVMGTSLCHMMLGAELRLFEGPLGVVKDGIIGGFHAYESGQTAGGDIYAWFVRNCVPWDYEERARREGRSVHALLSELAQALRPGESGLVALDWWNGNRSVLMDARLSGLLLGATLNTRPEDIYRALIEATAFGTRRIIRGYVDAGFEIAELVACGGLPEQNPFVMQVFADVCAVPIHVAGSGQAVALGAAMCGAAVAGRERGGFDTIQKAAARMAKPFKKTYRPVPGEAAVYDEIYAEYVNLHDHFGRCEKLMHRLRAIKARQSGRG